MGTAQSLKTMTERFLFSSVKLCDSGHAHIDLLDLIPGPVIHLAGLGKTEDILEDLHSPLCFLSVDAVYPDLRDQGITVGDGVELLLELFDLLPAASDIQSLPGQEARMPEISSAELIYISSPVIIAENLNRCIILIPRYLEPHWESQLGQLTSARHSTGSEMGWRTLGRER